jgi:DNA-binding response OmpR family regulator
VVHEVNAPMERWKALVAVEGGDRRAHVVQALVGRGFGVVDVEDGMDLLEVLGLDATRNGWYPDAIVADARLPRLDGIVSLAEVREFDSQVRAVVLVSAGDLAGRARALELGAAILDRATGAEDVAMRAEALLRTPSGRYKTPSGRYTTPRKPDV